MTTTAEKKRYEYQPKDDEGRNLGRPQVILYDTQEELIEKLTEQNKSVIKEMRNLKKNNRLGILEKENIPDTAPRFAPPVEFKPTELSVDDRIALARDLTDPLKMEAAFDRLTSAKFGAPVEKIREAITSTQQTMTDAQVRNEVSYFLQNTPDYYACKENFDTIYNWMVRYNLEPTRENFAMAFGRLTDAGILLQAGGTLPPEPTVQPVIVQEGPDTIVVQPPAPEGPVVIVPTTEEIADGEIEGQRAFQRINTGLSGTGTTSGGGPHMAQPTGNDITYTIPAAYDEDGKGNRIMRRQAKTVVGLKAIDAMDQEEYRARFNGEPGFKEKVNKLLGERKINPNQR
jgi:hypothetical protein